MKITVIVPIYNSENYISKCIESILSQSYENWELIIVDDGSTDNSYEICNKYAIKDSRIFLYKQNNKGVSSARNVGLSKTTGDYIMFIDSDDYIDEKTFEKCVEKIIKYNVDIVKFNYVKEFKFLKTRNSFLCKQNVLIEKPFLPIINNVFTTDNYCSSCECLVRSEVVKELKFDENIKVGEDFLFFMNTLMKSQSVYIMNDFLYHYRMHNKSVTNNFDYIKTLEYIKGLCVVVNKIYILIKTELGIDTDPAIKLKRNIWDYYKAAYQTDANLGLEKMTNLINTDYHLLRVLEDNNIKLEYFANISWLLKQKLIIKKYIKKII